MMAAETGIQSMMTYGSLEGWRRDRDRDDFASRERGTVLASSQRLPDPTSRDAGPHGGRDRDLRRAFQGLLQNASPHMGGDRQAQQVEHRRRQVEVGALADLGPPADTRAPHEDQADRVVIALLGRGVLHGAELSERDPVIPRYGEDAGGVRPDPLELLRENVQ